MLWTSYGLLVSVYRRRTLSHSKGRPRQGSTSCVRDVEVATGVLYTDVAALYTWCLPWIAMRTSRLW